MKSFTPLYGNALNLILSGVLAPLRFPCPCGGGDSISGLGFEVAIVVMRTAFVVSAEGGGGKLERSGIEERMCARQRKHSPLP